MTSRTSILCALATCALALPAAASGPSSSKRLPMQMDFDRCVLAAADIGNESLQGRVRLQLLIRPTGHVYAAFVHSEKGIADRRVERCLTSQALLWVLPPVELDYSRAYQLSFVPDASEVDFSNLLYQHGDHFAGAGRTSVFMPDINDPPDPVELNVRAAQATLDIAEFATEAESGIAQLEVRRYPEAIRILRHALDADEADALALRGLAVALAESGTSLREARVLGERLVSLKPESEASHEGLLRVCLAASDDPCAFAEFNAARVAADVNPRSRALAELQPLVEKAAARLRVASRATEFCAPEKGDAARALCVVRRCLDAGTAAYVEELSGAKSSTFEAQDWKLDRMGEGRLVLTRPIGDAKERHDARWLVKVGGQSVSMTPTNADARHITLRHSSCAVVQAAPKWTKEIAKGPAIEEPLDKLVQQQK